MGLKLKREKKRNLKLSLAYRLARLLPLRPNKKLSLFLDLAWILSRLAHEQSFQTDIVIPYDPDEDFLVTKIAKDAHVLDLGCGRGYVTKRMLHKTSNILGIDRDEVAIDVARKKFANTTIQFLTQDIFEFLKANEGLRFDVIVLSHVLEHIEEPGAFLARLQPSADYFYIEVPDFEATHLNLYRKLVNTDLVYTDIDHVSEFDRKELRAVMLQAGLEIVDSEFSYGVMRFWCKSIHAKS